MTLIYEGESESKGNIPLNTSICEQINMIISLLHMVHLQVDVLLGIVPLASSFIGIR